VYYTRRQRRLDSEYPEQSDLMHRRAIMFFTGAICLL
jgi:hypothetical protein